MAVLISAKFDVGSDASSKKAGNLDLPSLLLVDDDATFREVMARALARRGFVVTSASNVEDALRLARKDSPEYAVVDLKMPGPSGLELIEGLMAIDQGTRVVMLTGFASITTAIEAIKLGAIHYLAKPVDADQVVAAFSRAEGDAKIPIEGTPMPIERLEWEHIQRVLAAHDGNISATARALQMHRRTLQRKLNKSPG